MKIYFSLILRLERNRAVNPVQVNVVNGNVLMDIMNHNFTEMLFFISLFEHDTND